MNQREEDDVKFAFAFIGVLVAIVLFFVASCAQAQQGGQCYIDQYGKKICPRPGWTSGGTSQPTIGAAVRALALDVKVTVRDRGGTNSVGSGTPILRLADGRTVISTNYHVVQDRMGDTAINVLNGAGQVAVGEVIGEDPPNDLALIAIRAEWKYVNLGEEPPAGATVQIRGWPGGTRPVARVGRIGGSYNPTGGDPGMWVGVPSAQGMSGGGVFYNGNLVGVLWGTSGNRTAVTRLGPLRRLIARVCGRQQQAPAIYTPVAPPVAPTAPLEPLPGTQSNRCDCPAQFAAINAKLDAMQSGLSDTIDVKIAAAVSKFPPQPGVPGPPGPPGPKGEPGASCSIDEDALAQRITTAVLASIELPEPPATASHYVLVADEGASYWARLSDVFRRAQQGYSRIKFAAPPSYSVGGLPQIVEYQSGKPMRSIVGSRQVEEALTKLAQGQTP